MKLTFTSIKEKLSYEIELITQILNVCVVSFIYGHIEQRYIPTGTFQTLPGIFKMWSYYHLWMIALLSWSSLSLALSHIQWMLSDRKKYIWFICLANALASLVLEDIAWFITAGRGIGYDEWTMIKPGWGINAGFTYVPYWYLGITAACTVLYWLANKYASSGYKVWRLSHE